MKRIVAMSAVALALAIPSPAMAQQVGDWVLGQWRGEAQWYPGVIVARAGTNVTIRYDDGSTEIRPVNQVRPYDWRAGTRVTCQWTDGNWYGAILTRTYPDGLTIDVRYDDGVNQRTQTGRCRQDS